MVPVDDHYPCKPDIFEATYERADTPVIPGQNPGQPTAEAQGPEEGSMNEVIQSAEELDSLPIGSVVMTETHRGFGGGYEQRVWMRHGGQGSPLIHDWQSTDGGFQRVGEPAHARGMWAVNRNVTVLYRPDAPSLGADDQAGGPLKGAPKPTAETVADALIRYETGGICHYGQTCGLCDCGRSDQTAEQRRECDEHQLDRARAVLALIPPQRCTPSEDELAKAVTSGWVEGFDEFGKYGPQFDSALAARAVLTQAQAEALRQAARDWSDWDGLSAPEEWLARRAAAIESGATHG